jgi:hypothetical protein
MILRALLKAIGFGRAVAPTVEQPTAPPGAVQTTVAPPIETPKPSAQQPRRGRPRTYDPGRPASAAERKRRQRWVDGKNARHGCHENDFRDCHENPPPKEEEKKERAPPISKDWRPDADGERLGKQVFGDRYESELADHIDYCLKTDFRCHDHDANWRKRCRYFQRNAQLNLDLRPQARQVGVVEVIPPSKSYNGRRRRNRSVADAADELIAYARHRERYDSTAAAIDRMQVCAEESRRAREEEAPHSPEDKAKVKASFERFRRGGASG